MSGSGRALLLIGIVIALGSCVVFPSQFGSDYMGINLAGVLGAVVGLALALAGLAVLAWTDRSEP